MSDIKFAVGKKIYSLASDNKESGAKIVDIASRLNQKVNEIALSLRDLDDSTCVVLAGILILSELEDLKRSQTSLFENADIIATSGEESCNVTDDLVKISREDLDGMLKKIHNIESLLGNAVSAADKTLI